MRFSYNWLNSYFFESLPAPEEVAEVLTMGSFQVELVEAISLSNGTKDTVFDIDILSHRAADALGHAGIAKEIALHFDLPYKLDEFPDIKPDTNLHAPLVRVEDTRLCPRYMGRAVSNIKVGESPAWLKARLESVGQRSINSVVDAANYVMLVTNQPLHAFDADLLSRKDSTPFIEVRLAKSGERMTTLDGKELDLSSDDLILSDGKKVLGLAGIKGAAGVGVEMGTTNLVLEAANFSPRAVRWSSRRAGIRTDASIRFEHGISPMLAEWAMEMFTGLILELSGTDDTKVSAVADIFPMKPKRFKLGVTISEINSTLGVELTNFEVENILDRYQKYAGFVWQKTVPLSAVVHLGETLVGVPYKNPTRLSYDAPNFFDCSSLTAYICSEVGVQIPRVSVDQYVYGTQIEEKEVRAGDLVFANSGREFEKPNYEGVVHEAFAETVRSVYRETVDYMKGTKVTAGVDHVGMLMSDGTVLHATRDGDGVVIEKLADSASFQNIVGYRRVLVAEERYVVTAPYERIDLRSSRGFLMAGTSADLVEEIGRVYGYSKVKSVMPPSAAPARVNKLYYYSELISSKLIERGFSEVMTYTFGSCGHPTSPAQISNPIASDKAYLRHELTPSLENALATNVSNKELLGVATVKIFEVGPVFSLLQEEARLAIAIEKLGKKHDAVKEAKDTLATLLSEIGAKDFEVAISPHGVAEVSLSLIVETLPEPTAYADLSRRVARQTSFKEFSVYPFSVRDIAVWLSRKEDGEKLLEIAREKGGVLLAQSRLFDIFEKELEDGGSKVSIAYRLVFQAMDRTLTGDEVSDIMDSIYAEVAKRGWEVR